MLHPNFSKSTKESCVSVCLYAFYRLHVLRQRPGAGLERHEVPRPSRALQKRVEVAKADEATTVEHRYKTPELTSSFSTNISLSASPVPGLGSTCFATVKYFEIHVQTNTVNTWQTYPRHSNVF